jgi:hypothetical protein
MYHDGADISTYTNECYHSTSERVALEYTHLCG